MYLRFLDTLDALLNQLLKNWKSSWAPTSTQTLARLTTCILPNFVLCLGLMVSPNATKKGKNLLNVYLAHCLRVMNTYFEARSNSPGHSTWTSNRPTSSGIPYSHMLDVVVCLASLHKRIHNCCTTLGGLESNHCAVNMDLNLTSIEYKVKTLMNCSDIVWRKFCKEDEQRKLYNKYLLELTSRDMSYNNFCKAVVCAGKETAVAIDCKCKGWYTASKPSAGNPREESIAPLPP